VESLREDGTVTAKRNIVWRRWCDPLAPLTYQRALPPAYEPEEDEASASLHQARKGFGVRLEPEYEECPGDHGVFRGPVLTGPMGIIPLRESNLPGKLFNFWMGDTDFTLSKEVESTIKRVRGVETLDLFTRYRFRLGVGRLFDEKVVMESVEKAVQS
jgi:hypothetical protein